jgi:hypothetical protein
MRRRAQHPLRFVHRDRVVDCQPRAVRRQRIDDDTRRRFAHVVGIGLERETPDRERQAGQVVAEPRDDLVDEHALLRVVDLLDRVDQLERKPVLARGELQRLDVLRKQLPP